MQKILIVDDDEFMLRFTMLILSKAKKYELICASSGEEAINLFEKHQPDMVLSDLRMPEMDGYELYQKLQEKGAGNIPIMFMTADENDESESKGFEMGAADYIRKPLKADILLRRVANILENASKIHGLKQAVDIDNMTGLLNKTAVQREISKVCENSQGVLLMIDLDSFKLVNDLHGHAIGDMILIKFAELIKHVIRSTDIAGRMGGDEFIAFCQNVPNESIIADKASYLNEKIVEAAKQYMGEDMNIPLGVSIGAVFAPYEGTDFHILYQKADKALYKVKQNGKHGYAVYSEHSANDETAIKHKLSDINKILGERNEAQGAYFVELEHFKTIYRLAVRLVSNYQKEIHFINVTLESNNESDIEDFRNVLSKTLRKSDCITQNGKNQFFILLIETKTEGSDMVKQRIINNMKEFANLSKCKLDFQFETIHALIQ